MQYQRVKKYQRQHNPLSGYATIVVPKVFKKNKKNEKNKNNDLIFEQLELF